MKLRLLALITFIVGVSAGLAYAWLIEPVTYSESSPALAARSYREAWLLMAAEAYTQDGDWERTRIRLDALRDAQLGQTVAALFERYQANGPNAAARALAQLADRLGAKTAGMLVYLPRPSATPSPAPEPLATQQVMTLQPPTLTPTPEPLPTLTPSVTPVPIYRVIERSSECTPAAAMPQIQVFVQDEAGEGLPGKEVWVTWDGGADRFVTGFKPEIDPGYADFEMALDEVYNVALDKPTSVLISDLRAEPCEGEGHTSWRLTFGPVIP